MKLYWENRVKSITRLQIFGKFDQSLIKEQMHRLSFAPVGDNQYSRNCSHGGDSLMEARGYKIQEMSSVMSQ